MKIGSLGKIYQNSPMPPPKNLNFSIILIKKERTSAYMKIRFCGTICEKLLGKTQIFHYFDEKEPPTHETWMFGDIL